MKIEPEQKALIEQLKNKKVDNNKKYQQLKAIETQLFLEKNIILNKIIKDNFNTETWDNFIKGMKLTGVAFKGGIKGALGAAIGLVGGAVVIIGFITEGAFFGGNIEKKWSIPISVGIGMGGGCIVGVVTTIAILCPVTTPVTVPIAIASSGVTIVAGSIVEGTRSVNKKLKKWSLKSETNLSLQSVLNTIHHLQSLNDKKSKYKTKKKLAQALIEIKLDLLQKLVEQKETSKQLLTEQEILKKEISLLSSKIAKQKTEIIKANEPVAALAKEIIEVEKIIQKLESEENKINEVLTERQ